ncbi:hypothetical protein RvY_03201 [Ramazzottius varieornatus]|uniref:adenylate kinase n=1 Tax=Ramazzottius varieornatus TaxID=947166 RepID=A0A1D1UM80_RAMVA|nr:hypothetical protein RvY_03201 [Ramazzottius varieornatus]
MPGSQPAEKKPEEAKKPEDAKKPEAKKPEETKKPEDAKKSDTKKPVDLTELKKKNLPVVIVMGGPGCGKGTQCDKIKGKYGYTHLSTGDLLRADVASGSARGKELSAIMAKGELVSLAIVMDLLKEAMVVALPTSKGFLIDGFPRDMEQAEKLTAELGMPRVVINFECNDKILSDRCMERGKKSGRVDDNPESVKKRIETYHKQTMPVAEYYKKNNKLQVVKAERKVDEIFADVAKIIDKECAAAPAK